MYLLKEVYSFFGVGSSAWIIIRVKTLCQSGSNTNDIVNGKTPASRFADKLRGLSDSKRPKR